MMDSILTIVIKLLLLAPPILMALTVHEAAHAWVASRRGDPTARLAGRVSLNPIRHLDPMGTLVFFLTAWLGSGFGWAKPVPVDWRRLQDPRRDIIWISASGPAVNLLCAALLAGALNLLIAAGAFAGAGLLMQYLGQLLVFGVQVNTVLAFFNLLPLPPLDGSGILTGLLPPRAAASYQGFTRYGFAILLALIFLPDVIGGFPDVIGLVVLTPARAFMAWLMPALM
ncbi:MAG: site-2 protease family protein [Thermodesulfobacteriota bacterium]